MLIALLTVWLLGGGSTGFYVDLPLYQARAETAISDKQRAQRADDIFDALIAESETTRQTALELAEQLAEQVDRNEPSVEELGALQREFTDAQVALSKSMIEQRFKLLDVMTEEEWAAVFNAPQE